MIFIEFLALFVKLMSLPRARYPTLLLRSRCSVGQYPAKMMKSVDFFEKNWIFQKLRGWFLDKKEVRKSPETKGKIALKIGASLVEIKVNFELKKWKFGPEMSKFSLFQKMGSNFWRHRGLIRRFTFFWSKIIFWVASSKNWIVNTVKILNGCSRTVSEKTPPVFADFSSFFKMIFGA